MREVRDINGINNIDWRLGWVVIKVFITAHDLRVNGKNFCEIGSS